MALIKRTDISKEKNNLLSKNGENLCVFFLAVMIDGLRDIMSMNCGYIDGQERVEMNGKQPDRL